MVTDQGEFLPAGHRVGDYVLTGRIASGGMGEVYRARDLRLHREVALKLLPRTEDLQGDRLDRLEQEARAAAALSHPNIVTIYELGTERAPGFIAMELVTGCTLRFACAQPQPVSWLVNVVRQIAAALSAAHAAGVIHRDIKPENIMLRDDGIVKVLDFGLARLSVVDETDETQLLTRPGTAMGTPRYMSPEQLRGDRITAATDIFSLGVVFYELATGRHPFAGPNGVQVMRAIAAEQPLRPSRLNYELPGSIEVLILKMLEKAAEARPVAEEALAVLDAFERRPHRQTPARAGSRGTIHRSAGSVKRMSCATPSTRSRKGVVW